VLVLEALYRSRRLRSHAADSYRCIDHGDERDADGDVTERCAGRLRHETPDDRGQRREHRDRVPVVLVEH